MDEHEFQDGLLPRVLRLDAQAPDPNLVAAYVAGTLPPEEGRRLARQVEVDPEAMLLVRALRDDRRRSVVRRVLVAAAALVVAGFGVGRFLSRGPAETASVEERLVAAADVLAAKAPDLFAGFAPLPAKELESGEPVARGGGALTWPVGVLLEAPKELRWRRPTGASRVEVAVTGEGVAWSQRVEGDRVTAPAWKPGSYAVRLRALDALAGQEVRGAFTVATPADAETHRRALARIETDAPRDVRHLLKAHYALRHGLLTEAREAATAAGAEPATRPAAEALLRHVAARAPDLP
jgi:hypothetical protein